ncbi:MULTISPECIES: wax ester/triacylglycerol synthase family O-acyltransferase [unclassified Gordonia (in: high G+C Gram-positive bacteria)]|uniref:WS/DGAT/MGAT family O-acyltransferase n=1 Tax=unclassified Gordonia (in: high G+C Gram-positive bacteria) TaxID=2657482 RepID=UPI000990B3BA|nr:MULTISPECIES: wax ester/triacylglycerol synthase family O-acyltransferase [unclassified Gordonia (in: high G+C Gram-positive bacteria)]MCX2754077.1 wax ester/triacylglycerol synthase family O-acyltransferase [Gordonia sp. 4N]UCZ91941.1 wax ester/triacylglycerol synthase family O-acyltransferase [Gordonia sp. WA4-43]WGJ84821.1 wax ester/triacylglycerol synthase family O-acyltransferase [Gordonia sp. SMJS1]
MQRLSGLDASFLYLETRSQLMHVIGLFEIDPSTMPGGYRFDKLRAEMERRIAAIPAFRRKLDNSLFNIDHPVWIEDDDFDIERHVHRVGVPAPGGAREVAELCGHLAGQTLDRGKPLWELWIIEGLADGRVCAMLRMHHAGTDGVTGAEMLAQMCTLTPEPPDLDAEKVGESAGPSSRVAMAAGGAVNYFVQRPLAMAKLLPRTLSVPVGWFRRAQQDSAMPAPFRAPRTRFNAPITPHRSIAVTQLSLDDVKRVKDHFEVKLNDVVLAMVGGALRTYLLGHDELPDRPLVGMVPVSVHGADEKDLVVEGTNKVTGMFTLLSSDEPDPVARLRKQAELSRTSKEHHAEIDANILRSWAQFAPGTTLSTAMKIYGDRNWASAHPPVFNVLVSNVAGPDFPLYFLGARVTGVYPLGPIMHGLGLNITVFSADGNLNIGIVGCTDQTPDPWAIANAFDDEIKQLLAACD